MKELKDLTFMMLLDPAGKQTKLSPECLLLKN